MHKQPRYRFVNDNSPAQSVERDHRPAFVVTLIAVIVAGFAIGWILPSLPV